MVHDPVTGKNYDHRKDWSQNRLKHLASCFGIDVIAYCVMSNHTHQVLRSRPDVVAAWSDREVAIHWLRISPKFDKHRFSTVAADLELVEQTDNDFPLTILLHTCYITGRFRVQNFDQCVS